jgi:hypothetical protein
MVEMVKIPGLQALDYFDVRQHLQIVHRQLRSGDACSVPLTGLTFTGIADWCGM